MVLEKSIIIRRQLQLKHFFLSFSHFDLLFFLRSRYEVYSMLGACKNGAYRIHGQITKGNDDLNHCQAFFVYLHFWMKYTKKYATPF